MGFRTAEESSEDFEELAADFVDGWWAREKRSVVARGMVAGSSGVDVTGYLWIVNVVE